MTYKLSCGDVMPGCGTQFEAPDHDELMRQVGMHAQADHGITEFTPEIVSAVESRISVSA